jgi:hypothetical protein
MITITKDVEVELEVDMHDFEDHELLEELEKRNILVGAAAMDMINEIYEARKLGKPYEDLLDNLIYETIGRVA